MPYGKLEDILSREAAALNCHTNDDRRAWFAIDLGKYIYTRGGVTFLKLGVPNRSLHLSGPKTARAQARGAHKVTPPLLLL